MTDMARLRTTWLLVGIVAGCGDSSSSAPIGAGGPGAFDPMTPQGGEMAPSAPATPGTETPAPTPGGSNGPTDTPNDGTTSPMPGEDMAPAMPTTPGDDTPAMPGDMMVDDGELEDPRGKCDIDSGFPDDEACLLPPDPSEGFQIHVGPSDYNDPAEVAKFIMMPGGESSECWTFRTPNDEPIIYQTFELSGRAGTHHIINTMFRNDLPEGNFTACADPGTGTNANIIDNLPGASKPYMPRSKVAPENANIGREIPANAMAQADMHYFNITEEPILREFWLNIYYAKNEITAQADQIRGMGGLAWTALPIAPGTDQVYKYECPIVGEGRILSLLGHYHAAGVRFTANIRRAGTGNIEKVFEMYDYLDPATFTYDTVTTNPEFSDSQPGAVSGLLEVHNGDVMMWECHIINQTMSSLRYTNNVFTGEMCNLWGTSIGINQINCVLP